MAIRGYGEADPVPVCVSEDRWCYHSVGPKERACPAGYDCIGFSTNCSTPCDHSGENNVCSLGYCFWMGQ